MKDIYYADNRDLVKWGGIFHLCQATGIKNIVQVAYYRRQNKKELERERLFFDGNNYQFPDAVLCHFRNMDDIKRLGSALEINIEVIKDEFHSSRRKSFHHDICEKIQRMNKPVIVLLDPDTGLAPEKPTSKHVISDDIWEVYQSLRPRDVIAIYQHRSRRDTWKSDKKREFAAACQIKEKQVGEWGSELAKDVVFFYITR
jgi:hypothetical protein